MQTRKVISMLAVLLLSTCTLFAQNPHGQTSLAVPVTGTFAPSSTAGQLSSLGTGTLTGTFNISSFAVQNNQLTAIGTLIATVTNAAGQVTTVVLNNVAAPVAAAGTCPILTLTLGPLHLDLLGLVVDIPNPINLNIVAQSGPGNLLGNLLCSVTGLLNGGGALGQIATLLNQILAGLGL